jgi:hypothetical protein
LIIPFFAKWFVTEQMAPCLVYPEQEGKMLDLDSNAIALTADARF